MRRLFSLGIEKIALVIIFNLSYFLNALYGTKEENKNRPSWLGNWREGIFTYAGPVPTLPGQQAPRHWDPVIKNGTCQIYEKLSKIIFVGIQKNLGVAAHFSEIIIVFLKNKIVSTAPCVPDTSSLVQQKYSLNGFYTQPIYSLFIGSFIYWLLCRAIVEGSCYSNLQDVYLSNSDKISRNRRSRHFLCCLFVVTVKDWKSLVCQVKRISFSVHSKK